MATLGIWEVLTSQSALAWEEYEFNFSLHLQHVNTVIIKMIIIIKTRMTHSDMFNMIARLFDLILRPFAYEFKHS